MEQKCKIDKNISRVLMTNKAIKFTLECVPYIMNYLGIANTDYAIGGSMAGILYGIDFKRVPHDIDVIVPLGTIALIKPIINNSFILIEDTLTSSVDEEHGTNHYSFRTVKGFVIDIIEYVNFRNEKIQRDINNIYVKEHNSNKLNLIRIMGINTLIEAKKRYKRTKDISDLELLKQYKEEVEVLDNNNALNELKETMKDIF